MHRSTAAAACRPPWNAFALCNDRASGAGARESAGESSHFTGAYASFRSWRSCSMDSRGPPGGPASPANFSVSTTSAAWVMRSRSREQAAAASRMYRACFGIGWGLRRPLLVDPAGADRRPYRGVRTRSATNRAAKSGRPEGLRREGCLMRRKARRYSPVSASLFSCHAAFAPQRSLHRIPRQAPTVFAPRCGTN